MKSILIMLAVASAAKVVADFLPDAVVEAAFMYPAAKLAALYWGVPLASSPLVFSVRGVALEVTRACSATDFFSMAFALMALALPVRRAALRAVAALPCAWAVAVFANAVRLVVLAVVDRAFPRSAVPAVHMAAGIAVFLPVLSLLWYNFARRKDSPDGNRPAE